MYSFIVCVMFLACLALRKRMHIEVWNGKTDNKKKEKARKKRSSEVLSRMCVIDAIYNELVHNKSTHDKEEEWYAVTLSGMVGIGKSRFGSDLKKRLSGSGYTVIIVSADAHPNGYDAKPAERHEWAQEQMRNAFAQHTSCVVIVDNTTVVPRDFVQYGKIMQELKITKNFVCKFHPTLHDEKLKQHIMKTAEQVRVKAAKVKPGEWRIIPEFLKETWLTQGCLFSEMTAFCGDKDKCNGRSVHSVPSEDAYAFWIRSVAFMSALFNITRAYSPTKFFHVQGYMGK
jgi:hypothetical protein